MKPDASILINDAYRRFDAEQIPVPPELDGHTIARESWLLGYQTALNHLAAECIEKVPT